MNMIPHLENNLNNMKCVPSTVNCVSHWKLSCWSQWMQVGINPRSHGFPNL